MGIGVEWVVLELRVLFFCLLFARKITTFLELEFNRAQTGLAIDDNVLGECITCDFVCFTTHSTPFNRKKGI